MLISIDGTYHEMTCFRCGKDVEPFNINHDLRCPDCKIVVSQAGLISAYEEFVAYLAAEEVKKATATVKGFKPTKLLRPPLAFTNQG